jgi:hypothetical protein
MLKLLKDIGFEWDVAFCKFVTYLQHLDRVFSKARKSGISMQVNDECPENGGGGTSSCYLEKYHSLKKLAGFSGGSQH